MNDLLPDVPRRLAGALAILAVAAGCSVAPAPQSPGTPVLQVDDLEARAMMLLIADRRTYEPVAAGIALDGGPEVRRMAALTLGRIGDPRGGADLEALLGDPDLGVRRAAVFALGELGEAGYDRAADALARAAVDPDRVIGRLAVEGLAKSGAPVEAAVEALITGASTELLPRLLPSLFRFQRRGAPSDGVVRWAVQGLEEDDPELHALAAYALARVPLESSAPLLEPLLRDGDPWVRGWAARALGEVGGRPHLDLLRPLLDDPEAGPIVHALRAAKRLCDAGTAAPPEAWRPRVLELLDDPRPGVRLTAIEASAAWLLDDALSARLAELAAAGEPRERQLALLALAEGEDPLANLALVRATVDGDPAIRRAAVRAAGLLGAASTLEELARDTHPGVRAEVLQTWLDAAPEGAAERAAAALEDRDAGVRATALEWAVDHPELPLETLLAGLGASRHDRILDARLAAVQALEKRAQAEPLERGTIVARLEELARDDEFLVRRQAVAALGALDQEPPKVGAVRVMKSVDLYREIVQRTARPRRVEVRTDRGAFTVELACPEAPLTCLDFLQLASQGFYDGLTFHRVVPDFVVQAGDPRGDGRGGPGYTIRDEMNLLRYDRGAVGMALAGPDTGGSQFFVTLSPQPHLDGGYTVFGRVVAGDATLDALLQGDRILGVTELPTP